MLPLFLLYIGEVLPSINPVSNELLVENLFYEFLIMFSARGKLQVW